MNGILGKSFTLVLKKLQGITIDSANIIIQNILFIIQFFAVNIIKVIKNSILTVKMGIGTFAPAGKWIIGIKKEKCIKNQIGFMFKNKNKKGGMGAHGQMRFEFQKKKY